MLTQNVCVCVVFFNLAMIASVTQKQSLEALGCFNFGAAFRDSDISGCVQVSSEFKSSQRVKLGL